MIGKYKIAVVIAYFGNLPNWFNAWRVSALRNDNIDFLFFTDNHLVTNENNIIVNYMSFSHFRQCIQKKFNFKIVLDTPYKICDYKPSYGFVFGDWLSEYDFWGYCDIDLIFGKIDNFVTEEILDKYPHIHQIGHFSLFRNNEIMNTLFMDMGCYPEYNYTEAFSTSDSCYFDEFRGMEIKCKRQNIATFNFIKKYVDILPYDHIFKFESKQIIGRWINGHLYREYLSGIREEILYIHISKRNMNITNDSIQGIEDLAIVPGMIIINCRQTIETLFNFTSGDKRTYKFIYIEKRLIKQIKRYGIIKMLTLKARDKKIHKYIHDL